MAKRGGGGEILVRFPNAAQMPDDPNTPVFDGKETYTLDDKGRVTVPKRWRRADGRDEEYHLVPDVHGKCLRVMRRARFLQFAEEVRERVGSDLNRYRAFMRNYNSNSIRIETDKQGRIAIPKGYCETLALRGAVLMLGCGDLIEVWNPPAYVANARTELADYQDLAGGVGL